MIKLMLLIMCCFLISSSAIAQPTYEYYVDPGMIQISYTGELNSFIDASVFVKNVQITVGDVTDTHTTHARKGSAILWEGQMGSPILEQKCSWELDLSLIPVKEHKVYMRFSFGFIQTNEDGTIKHTVSWWSVSSEPVKLIGRPGKPKHKGQVE